MELFLDANAHIPVNKDAARVYLEISNSLAGHGHPLSPSLPGRKAAELLEESRGKIARLLSVNVSNIIFTAGATQAAEWAMEIFGNLPGEHFCSPMEHSAIKTAFEKIKGKYFTVSENGKILDNIKGNICCIHLQNEIGTIQDFDKFSGFIFSDMTQSLGKVPIDLSKIDLAVFGAHKFGGFGGLGWIYLKDISKWKAFGTGSRYFLDRTGTPDVAGIAASAVALEKSLETLPERTKNMNIFQYIIESEFDKMGIEIIGKGNLRSPNTTFINLPGQALNILLKMGERGIYLGLGSACGSLHGHESPLMKVLGKCGTPHDFLRISQYGEYGEKEAREFLDIFKSCYEKEEP